MLFNSFTFLFLFLPITVVVFFILAKLGKTPAAAWLVCASLFFYGWWSIAYIPLLLASIGFNYSAGWHIGHAGGPARKRLLWSAVVVNLGLLVYFKYADFFVSSANFIAQTDIPSLNIILPIGISFFTFTQIAFLVDTYQGKLQENRFLHYLLFVTYFPHLIAGPVLHHKEMMPQFDATETYRASFENTAVGLSIFSIGLAKKVLIADNLAPHASFLFDQSGSSSALLAWGGVLAYTFQLYFDFSGYSDMAIGVSRLFGIQLPLNFNSPYKSTNIVEFWRRWHMTLSRFLRDYLYISLGGNRHGPLRRQLNLMLTMILGGLWHGAGWNFVIWGALHGAYLILNHAWNVLTKRSGLTHTSRAWTTISIAVTFVAVCFAWVFFRAKNIDQAWQIVQGMVGVNGIALPRSIGSNLGSVANLLERCGMTFYMGGGTHFIQNYAWVAVAAMIAFFLPNTQQLLDRFNPGLNYLPDKDTAKDFIGRYLSWRPNTRWAYAIGILTLCSLLSLSRPAEFLYFQF